MKTILVQKWTGLASRERVVVLVGTAFVVIALLYLSAVEPAWRTRSRLTDELPRLRADAAEVEALRIEAASLRKQKVNLDSLEYVVAAIGRLLAERNLKPAALREIEERRILVSLKRADAAAAIGWLADLSSELPLRVSAARLSRAGAGAVDVEITFSPVGQKW